MMTEPQENQCSACSKSLEGPGLGLVGFADHGMSQVTRCPACFAAVWTQREQEKEAERDRDLDEHVFRDLRLRPVTKRLVGCLYFNRPLPPPVITDFGLRTEAHERALRAVLFNGLAADNPARRLRAMRKRIVALEKALGHGSKLMALVRKYAPAYAAVTFSTVWDDLARDTAKLRSTG